VGPCLADAAPGDRSRNAVRVSSRYVEARTIAATIVAASCIGGSIPTSDLFKVRRFPGYAAPWQDQHRKRVADERWCQVCSRSHPVNHCASDPGFRRKKTKQPEFQLKILLTVSQLRRYNHL
jgi:hypothetical protein